MRIMGFKKLAQTIGFDVATTIARHLSLNGSSDAINTLIEELNKEYFFCIATHKVYRYTKNADNSYNLTEANIDGMRMRYASRIYQYNSVRLNKCLSMNPADIFYEHPNRNTVESIVFDPEKPMGFYVDRVTSDFQYFNQWSGWPYQPKPGDWSKLKKFLLTGAFDGVQAHYDWFIKWLAFKIQNPHKLPEMAVIFYGINLVGKSFLCEFVLPSLFGMSRSLPSADLSSLGKDFNAQFQNKFFVHICESNLAKVNRKHIGNILKKMITSTDIEIEGKGKDSVTSKNYCVFVFTTNEFGGVPIENDLRRFAAFEFGTAYLNRHDLFAEIEDEFNEGGAEAFLYHLLYEVKFEAFETIPNTFDENFDPGTMDQESLATFLEETKTNHLKKNKIIKAQLREVHSCAPKTQILSEIEAASDNIYKKCWRIFIETGFIHNTKIMLDPDEKVYISTKDFFIGCQERIFKFGRDERSFCVALARELVEMCGKDWTEPTRVKVNPSLPQRLKYPLTGSYAYHVSRREIAERHKLFRHRSLEIKDKEDSDEIITQILGDVKTVASKYI